MRPEFEDYNIQSEAKTLDDIKRAAITTEKVLHAKSSKLNVNVISHRDIMGLPGTMKLLMKKVENLNEENRFLKGKILATMFRINLFQIKRQITIPKIQNLLY